MKRTLLLCLLMAAAGICSAQYEAAVRYLDTTLSFYAAMDTLIAHANPADTGEANQLVRLKNFMGSRISNDVAAGDERTGPMITALKYYRDYYSTYCPGSGYTGNWKCVGPDTRHLNERGSFLRTRSLIFNYF
jgi:hypothetical protein